MADIVDKTKAVANDTKEQEKIELTANGEQNADTAQSVKETGAPNVNSEAHQDDAVAGADEKMEEKQDDSKEKEDSEMKDGAEHNDDSEKNDISTNNSPDKKRKEPPASVSAHHRRNKKNIKTRFDQLEESTDPDEIRHQVEFYFSDSNLPIDNYLLQITGGHMNKPVDLKIIHNFKRMQHFQPFSAVRDAVQESNFLNIDKDNQITRKEPLDKKFTDNVYTNRSMLHTSSMHRSVYVKGFGEETESSQLDLEKFFEDVGDVKSVRLRRYDDGTFKGSVFVEFADEEQQQIFLSLEPKPTWNGKELDIQSKQDYVELKNQGILDGSVKPRSPGRRPYNSDRKPSRGRDNYHRRSNDYDDRKYDKRSRDDDGDEDMVDKDDWKSRRDRDQKHDKRDRYGGRGRGRGRGRGGRGGRDDRGPRDRRASPDADRDLRRGREDENDKKRKRHYEEDEIDKLSRKRRDESEGEPELKTPSPEESKKRARDETDEGYQSMLKKAKLDDETEGPQESKKRARDEDEDGREGKEKKAKQETLYEIKGLKATEVES